MKKIICIILALATLFAACSLAVEAPDLNNNTVGCWINVKPTDHGHDDWCQKYDNGKYKMHNYMRGQCLFCDHRCSHLKGSAMELVGKTVRDNVTVETYRCRVCEDSKTVTITTSYNDSKTHKITSTTKWEGNAYKPITESKTESHKFSNGICSTCGYECEHFWVSHNIENGIVSECIICNKIITVTRIEE